MSFTPPPPPGTVEEKPPPVAWLVPAGAVLAVIGAFTPWFKPEVSATVNGRSVSESVDDALYSFKDGKIGLIAPILLAVVGIGVVALMTGRQAGRFSRSSSGPVVAAARGAMIAGAVSLVAVVIAWFLVTTQYKFDNGQGRELSWDDFIKFLEDAGAKNVDIGRGPQIGYFLTIAGAVVALVGGVLMLVMRQKPTAVPPAQGYAPPAPNYGPPSGPPQSGPYSGPQSGPQSGPPSSVPPAPPAASQPGYPPPPQG